MKTTICLSEFRDAFRSVRPDNFSYEALGHLFEYLEQHEQDTGYELELDVIAICCDFSEDTWQNIADQYGLNPQGHTDDEKQEHVADYLSDQGAYVATVRDCIVYRQF